jgi:formylglycine-generating enzyme required for sulfatase activity
VEQVSWTDATAFCTTLTQLEQNAGRLPSGWAYVLPTEAQWEYACRAGTTTAYSWGNSIANSNANYNSNIGQTRDVGQYAANPWGFFDMHGNVWEWVNDRYQNAYPGETVTDPTGFASGSTRILRGGDWGNAGTTLRSARRTYLSPPSHRRSTLGFRLSLRPARQ